MLTLPITLSKELAMGIQSQDVEKQRQGTQGEPRPTQARNPPRDRPPGQPHDPPPQSDRDNTVARTPTQDSPDATGQGQKRDRKPQPPG